MMRVVLRRSSLSRMLWTIAGASAAAACGRLGFGLDEGAPALAVPPSLRIETECGVMPASYPLEILNTSGGVVRIDDVEIAGGFAITNVLPLEIQPGEGARLTVRPPAAVIGTDRGGDTKTGALTLLTSAGAYMVELAADVRGANIEVTDLGGLPLTLTFSGPQCPAPITARVVNSGNRSATIPSISPFAFRINGFVSGSVILGGGASTSLDVRPYTSSACANSESLTFTVTGSVCTTTPIVLGASFNLTGSMTCSCT